MEDKNGRLTDGNTGVTADMPPETHRLSKVMVILYLAGLAVVLAVIIYLGLHFCRAVMKGAGLSATQAQEDGGDGGWEKTIFGNEDSGLYPSRILTAGLAENEKEQIGFVESAFVKAAAGFLEAQGIHTGKITFSGTIGCSSENAVAYRAQMEGYGDRELTVIFYPDYPGKYLFTLS